ncbi:MAG: hypothetical protein LBB21_05890 [Holosporaceae bacterium]|jgi:hypothetical protein|nr:hypothetical protein [Holosporaceae bacterium]
MKKILVALCVGIFGGTILICFDLIAAERNRNKKQRLEQREYDDSNKKKRRQKKELIVSKEQKKKIIHSKEQTKEQIVSGGISSKRKRGKNGSKKNKKEDNAWKDAIASVDEKKVNCKVEQVVVVEPIVDKSQIQQGSIKIESQPITKIADNGALLNESAKILTSSNSRLVAKAPEASESSSASDIKNVLRDRSGICDANVEKEIASDLNILDESTQLVANKIVDGKKNAAIVEQKHAPKNSAAKEEPVRSSKFNYKIDAKESTKFREELEKYRAIYVGAR